MGVLNWEEVGERVGFEAERTRLERREEINATQKALID